jgi:hydroxyacid-oxoacid transhydrogenase
MHYPSSASVALTGPAGACTNYHFFFLMSKSHILLVFQFTAPSSPERHRQALAIFKLTTPSDPSIERIPNSSIGAHLFEAIAQFLDKLGVPRGLKAIGYKRNDVNMLVEGTLPQRRVLDLAPGISDAVGEDEKYHLGKIIENSMEF